MDIYNFFVMPHPPIMVKEVGRGEEAKIQATLDACLKVAETIRDIEPETIIIITPHGPMFSDAIAISLNDRIEGSFRNFSAPSVKFDQKIDKELTESIMDIAKESGIFMAEINPESANLYGLDFELDHGTTVPLYSINQRYKDFKLVHITYGLLPKEKLYDMGRAINKAVRSLGRKAVLIASADLSHRLIDEGPYDYSPYGEKFDREVLKALEEGNLEGVMSLDPVMVEEAGQCGLRSFYIMLGAMDKRNFKGRLLSYEGTFGVGYGVMEFTLNPYVNLARQSIEHYLKNESYMKLAEDLPDFLMKERAAVFVTLFRKGQLRGCIGSILPQRANIAEEIIVNAVSAGFEDPRFMPLNKRDLEDLDISVDVLGEIEPTDFDGLDPKSYGVIVSTRYKRGLLLPRLEGIDTAREQVEIALQKAHIGDDEDYELERFKVTRHI